VVEAPGVENWSGMSVSIGLDRSLLAILVEGGVLPENLRGVCDGLDRSPGRKVESVGDKVLQSLVAALSHWAMNQDRSLLRKQLLELLGHVF
jgi:hypothetical protein